MRPGPERLVQREAIVPRLLDRMGLQGPISQAMWSGGGGARFYQHCFDPFSRTAGWTKLAPDDRLLLQAVADRAGREAAGIRPRRLRIEQTIEVQNLLGPGISACLASICGVACVVQHPGPMLTTLRYMGIAGTIAWRRERAGTGGLV